MLERSEGDEMTQISDDLSRDRTGSSSGETEAVIRRLYAEVHNTHDLDRAPEFFAPDFVNHGPVDEVGIEPLQQRIGVMFTAFPDAEATLDHVVVQNDRAMVFLSWRGHLAGTGDSLMLSTANLYRVRDGLVVEHGSVIDQSGLTRFGMPAAEQRQVTDDPDWKCSAAEAANLRLVLTVWDEIMVQHKLERADDYYRQDYVQHNRFAAASGAGLAGMKEFFAGLFTIAPDLKGTITQIVVQDDLVGLFVVWTGTEAATGSAVKLDTADLLRVENGRIAEHWDVFDYSAVARFGVTQPSD